jgi:carbonic anhydrase
MRRLRAHVRARLQSGTGDIMTAELDRRRLLAAAGLAATAVAAGIAAAPHPAAAQALTAEPVSPEEALQRLRDGNTAFLRGQLPPLASVGGQRRLEIAQTQRPFATLVSCSDSRVPPEVLFGRGLGELFIIRNAGNTVDTAAMGSLEFSVAVLGVPLVVVMGHERCGAVKAAQDVVEKNATFPGSIGRMIEPIIPAVLQARGQAGDPLDAAIRANVARTVNRLKTQSEPMILDPLRAGKLKIVGATYDLDDGRVTFFDA